MPRKRGIVHVKMHVKRISALFHNECTICAMLFNKLFKPQVKSWSFIPSGNLKQNHWDPCTASALTKICFIVIKRQSIHGKNLQYSLPNKSSDSKETVYSQEGFPKPPFKLKYQTLDFHHKSTLLLESTKNFAVVQDVLDYYKKNTLFRLWSTFHFPEEQRGQWLLLSSGYLLVNTWSRVTVKDFLIQLELSPYSICKTNFVMHEDFNSNLSVNAHITWKICKNFSEIQQTECYF